MKNIITSSAAEETIGSPRRFQRAASAVLLLASLTAISIQTAAAQGSWSGPFYWGNGNPASVPSWRNPNNSNPDYREGQVAVHMSVLPNGQVLSVTGWYAADPQLWDPLSNTFTTVPLFQTATPDWDLFCAGHNFLPDGRLVFAGGYNLGLNGGYGQTFSNIFYTVNNNSTGSHFDPNHAANNGGWIGPSDDARWYPTLIGLNDGRVLAVAGSKTGNIHGHYDSSRTMFTFNNQPNDPLKENSTAEVYAPDPNSPGNYIWSNSFSFQKSDNTSLGFFDQVFYPWLHLAPNGKVFNSGPSPNTRYLTVSQDQTSPYQYHGTAYDPVIPTNSDYRIWGSSVMYQPGKILITGGSRRWYYPDDDTGDLGFKSLTWADDPTNTAEIIDLNLSSPAWQYTTTPMQYARKHHNSTLLPDGTVLVTGGTSSRHDFFAGLAFSGASSNCDSSGGCEPDNTRGAVLAPELWTPPNGNNGQGSWTTMASAQWDRMYHSVAVLLPDARVLVAGGDWGSDVTVHPAGDVFHPLSDPGWVGHTNAEIFSPPYLARGSGSQPTISRVTGPFNNTALSYTTPIPYKNQSNNSTFRVYTPQASQIFPAGRATLVRLPSVTHSFDENQRFYELTIIGTGQDQQYGNYLIVQAPSDGSANGLVGYRYGWYDCPRGIYMLFILIPDNTRPGGYIPSTAAIVNIGW